MAPFFIQYDMKHLILLSTLLSTTFFPRPSPAQSICYSLSRYYRSNDADSVLHLADSALASARRAHCDQGIAKAFLSKGIAYELKEEHVYALNCYLEALQISDRLGMDGFTGDLYGNIGIVYAHLGNYPRAREYYSRALPIIGASHDSVGMAAILLSIGDDYEKMGQPERALGYFARCEAIALPVHDEEDIAWAAISRAEALRQEHKYLLSIRYAAAALDSARRFSFAGVIRECYSVLYADYRALRDFERALQYRDLEASWKDSLYSVEKEKKISSLQNGYELEKRQHQIDLLNQDRFFEQQKIGAGQQRQIMFAASALFFSVWALFLFRSNKEKVKLNRQLRSRNRDRYVE